MHAAGISTEGKRPKIIDSYEKPAAPPKSAEPPKEGAELRLARVFSRILRQTI